MHVDYWSSVPILVILSFQRRLWVFADAPHLIKLLRHHVMEQDGGLLVPNRRGGRSLLGRRSFEDVLALDSGELRICPKLERLCVEVTAVSLSVGSVPHS